MNAAHIHIAVNHVPVVGIGFGLLALVVGMIWGSEPVKRLSLLCFVAIGLACVPAYFSGGQAEEIVEHLPGVEHDRIEEHEDAGRLAAIACGVLGVVSAVLLWLFRSPRALAGWALGVVLVISLAVGGAMARTATLGGEIRHEEIREGFRPAS